MFKRFQILLVLLGAISLISLNGCIDMGNDYNEEMQSVIETNITIKGKLKSLANATANGSNYLLDAEDDKVYTLVEDQSGTIRDTLIGQEIEVSGTIKEENGEKTHVIKVKSIKKIKDDNEDSSIKAVWQDYKNEYNGISFKRMGNWVPEQDGEKITFYFPPEDLNENEIDDVEKREKIVIERFDNPNKETMEKWLDDNYSSRLEFVKSSIGDESYPAYKKEENAGKKVMFIVQRGNVAFYKFEHIANSDDYFVNRNKFFDLLFSVNFIDFSQSELNENNDEEDDNVVSESPAPTPADKEEITETPEPTIEPEPSPSPSIIPSPEVSLEPTPKPTEKPSPSPSPKTSDTGDKQTVADYIKRYINNIAPEQSVAGTWKTTSIEFVEPDYAYIEYNDGIEKRKLLVKYSNVDELEFEVIGAFKEGSDRDWEIIDGSNPVATEKRIAYEIDGDGAVKESIVVKEGFRYFESKPFNFKIQYPSNWYYAGYGSQGDYKAVYKFSTKPLDQSSDSIITLFIHTDAIDSFAAHRVSDSVYSGKYDGSSAFYAARNDGGTFVIIANDSDYADTARQMIDSLVQ